MFAFAKPIFAAAAIAATTFVAGCQAGATTKPTTAATMSAQTAVTCTKCEITWVRDPQTQKGRVVGYSSRKVMECPDCRSAAENFFATGKLEHTCKSCGDTMQACEMH
jgi:hypothetical protein